MLSASLVLMTLISMVLILRVNLELIENEDYADDEGIVKMIPTAQVEIMMSRIYDGFSETVSCILATSQ